MERLYDFIDWCHANDLEFHITEFNSWIDDPFEENWEKQAETFYSITKLTASKYTTGVVGINFWHIRGVETANKDRDGGLWSEDYLAKPGYYDVKRALYEIANGIGPTIKNHPPKTAIKGSEYAFEPVLSGTTGAPTFSFQADKTANWLTIDENGMLRGTPETNDTLWITYTVTDDIGPRTLDYQLIIYDEPIAIHSKPDTTASEDYLYEYSPEYTGFGEWTFTAVPEAPWLTIDESGRLYGIPDNTSSYEITLTLSRHDTEVSQSFTLEVLEKLEILSEPRTEATEEEPYRYQLNYKGYGSFSIQTTPEAEWLTIDQDGLVSGTPPESDTIEVNITAMNDLTTVYQEYDLRIAEKLEITSEPITTARVGEEYEYQLEYRGIGDFEISSTSDISWLAIDSTGLIQGTPIQPDTVNVKLRFQNSVNTVYQVFNIYIEEALWTRSRQRAGFQIFPSPARGRAIIHTQQPGSALQLYDLNGKLISEMIIQQERQPLLTGNLKPGLYLYRYNEFAGKINILK